MQASSAPWLHQGSARCIKVHQDVPTSCENVPMMQRMQTLVHRSSASAKTRIRQDEPFLYRVWRKEMEIKSRGADVGVSHRDTGGVADETALVLHP
jgi:hypothetical protein